MAHRNSQRRPLSRRFQVAVVAAAVLFSVSAVAVGWATHSAPNALARQDFALAALEGEGVYVLEEVTVWPFVDYLPARIANSLETFEALTVVLDGDDASVANLERLRDVPQLIRLVITGATMTAAHHSVLQKLMDRCPRLHGMEV